MYGDRGLGAAVSPPHGQDRHDSHPCEAYSLMRQTYKLWSHKYLFNFSCVSRGTRKERKAQGSLKVKTGVEGLRKASLGNIWARSRGRIDLKGEKTFQAEETVYAVSWGPEIEKWQFGRSPVNMEETVLCMYLVVFLKSLKKLLFYCG